MKKSVYYIIVICLMLSFLGMNVFAYYDYDSDYYGYNDYYEDEYYIENDYEDVGFEIGKAVLISIGVGLVISLIVTGIMRSKMKSVRFERAAKNYIRPGSMKLLRSHDMYLYSHVTKTPKPQNNKKS